MATFSADPKTINVFTQGTPIGGAALIAVANPIQATLICEAGTFPVAISQSNATQIASSEEPKRFSFVAVPLVEGTLRVTLADATLSSTGTVT